MQDHLPQYQLYTSEKDANQIINRDIERFWENMAFGTVRTRDKKTLRWCKCIDANHSKSLLIINGRVESIEKYRELFFELFNQGYDIYSYDHRGQGLSSRLTSDPQMGYVDWFNDYTDDLHCIIQHFNFNEHSDVAILAHSMGGAIALRYLQSYPSIFKALILTSPMLGFTMPWYLRPVAMFYAQIRSGLSSIPKYVKGYGPYTNTPFNSNPLSHSQTRYQCYRRLYLKKPELQLGGPSYRWVWQSLMAVKQCYLMTRQIDLPVLVMQAGNDLIVDNSAQDRFFSKLKRTNPKARLTVIKEAYHELFFESDKYRDQALAKTLDFLQQHMK
ncbi:alpha/beta fold hydrolase [Vibrio salinus]|uniref:alpha/beta fold hydrolase n=1 Tax=Vibrio salinus TaxID=2899784 RepID=UPI001E2C4BF0|nr:alpha/beta fold hydrolase [Vibrio salinus]MCE0493545.1 alpha/beta fold hydrolase [Vibrio salinus]